MSKQFKGIDVSSHQKIIDWEKVKKAGIEYAILRLGYGSDMINQDDAYFLKNVKGCEDNGIPWGAYLYSYAMTLEAAESEVAHTLRILKGLKPTYPIYFDMEDADAYKAKRGGISKQLATDICYRFCDKIEAAGYYVGVYANKDWLDNKLYADKLSRFTTWLAQWSSKPTYKGPFDMWQYSSDGSVSGISGRVDMNISYKDFPTIIKNLGCNGWKKETDTKPPIVEPSKPTPEAENKSKYKIGDIIYFNGGKHYSSSDATSAAGTVNASRAKVTNVSNGSKYPVHLRAVNENGNFISGVYGWVEISTIKESSPSTINKDFSKGQKVAVKETATYYYPGGEKIPSWVKSDYYHFIEQTTLSGKSVVKGGKECVLLGKKMKKGSKSTEAGIVSWIAKENISLI